MNISVVIPTHNRSDLLQRAVNSVLNQTHKDLEVIIVSDGSTDDTDAVIDQLKRKDDRVKGISYHPAQGANTARNTGVKAAQYPYVAFLDDDDEWYPDKLEAQIEVFARDNKIGLVYTGRNVVYVNEKQTYSVLGSAEGDLSRNILIQNLIGTTSSVMVKKALVEEVGGFDTKMPAIQDYDLWIRICQKTLIGVVPEEKLYYYNYTGKKQISSNIKRYETARSIMNKKYESLFKRLTDEDLRNIKVNRTLSHVNLALRNEQKKVALGYTLEAISIKPSIKSIGYLFLILLPYKHILKIRGKV